MKPICLIQLISEQTMQNLLPILRLQPARLIHLATPRTAARSAFIIEAARQAGQKPEVEIVHLSAMPAIQETSRATAAAIDAAEEEGYLPIVNFTGGTKLMSIGAFAAAHNRKSPSIYVDTQDETFIDGGTGAGIPDFLENDFSFTPVRSKLQVNVVAVAHGKERVTGGIDWKPFLPLARHLQENPADEQEAHALFCGGNGLFSGQNQPREPQDWLQLLDTRIRLPQTVQAFALETGLLESLPDGSVRFPQRTRVKLEELIEAKKSQKYVPDFNKRLFTAIQPIQEAQKFLSGGWWEVLVAEAARQSGHFRDIRWSAEVGERDGASMEEDILALQGVQIVNISCKRGGHRARLLPLLEEHSARTRSMGGYFSRSFLAIYNPPRGKTAHNLRQTAQKLGITILTPNDLNRPEVFAAK